MQRRSIVAGLIALAMAAAPATSASAGTLHVTNGNDAGAGTLRQAIAEAQTSGDTIVIDPGVTKVTVASPLTIDKSLVVQGQGAGATQIASSVPSFWRIFEVGIVTQGISVRIEALKISGGRGPAGTPGVNENPGPGFLPAGPGGAGGSGGAILNRANQLTLADLTLSENIAGTGGPGGESITGTLPPGSGGAGGSGGAISNSGTMTILRSTLAGNEAGVGGFPGITPSSTPAFASSGAAGGGGAISNNGTMAIVDSTISGNRAAAGNLGSSSPSGIGENGTAGGGGGAIQNTGTLTLSRSTLSGNVAGTGGNGSSGFTTNGAGGTGGSGGALFLNGGGAQITNSTFSGNYAGPGGGGGGFGFSFGGAGGSGGSGGAIMVTNGATVTLAASTLSGNAVGKGGAGGPGSPGGTPGSEGAGGGVSEVLSNFLIRNSLLVSNTGIGGNCSGLPGKVDGGGNLVFPEAGSCTGFPVGDPKLDPAGLANNGGPTQTIALQSGSAAFNLVPTASCTDAAGAPLTADQRGEPRPQFGACDAGAFEIAEPKKPPTAATAPKVTFTKKPKKVVKTRKKRAKVKFAFTSDTAGAKFECKLDKEPFKPCKSPKRLRLKPGRHTFLVRGTSAGLTGEAAKAAFKVKRLKARHKRASQ